MTEKEKKLKEKLLWEGFSNWGKKEFFHFITLCEWYGWNSYEKIANELPNKSVEDVKIYSEKFQKNYKNIKNGDKYMEWITKGEQDIQKLENVQHWILESFKSLPEKFELSDIEIHYEKGDD